MRHAAQGHAHARGGGKRRRRRDVESKQKQDRVDDAMTSPRALETSQHNQDVVVSEIQRKNEIEAAADDDDDEDDDDAGARLFHFSSFFSDRTSQKLNILFQNENDEIQ